MEQRNTIRQEDILYSLFLDHIPGVGRKTVHRLLATAMQPEELYAASEKQRQEWVEKGLLGRKQEEAWKYAKSSLDLGKLYEEMRRQGISCVPYHSAGYPRRLSELTDPPVNLYVRGKLPPDQKPAVAVVGARLCSDYGSYMAKQIGRTLAGAGIQVISGMAMGVDGISQQATMEAGGNSYGVLGCGVDICYPQQNQKLYELLIQKGGVLSEYCPGTKPKQGFFPERNRIISGLSDAVLVVEAREKSGTLITVDAALEQGREVYAVPGRATDLLAAGCNRLIAQGADIVLSVQAVADEVWKAWETKYEAVYGSKADLWEGAQIHKAAQEQKPDGMRMSETYRRKLCSMPARQRAVAQLLSEQGISVDELAGKLLLETPAFTVAEITSELMKLCVEQFADVRNGYFYRKE